MVTVTPAGTAGRPGDAAAAATRSRRPCQSREQPLRRLPRPRRRQQQHIIGDRAARRRPGQPRRRRRHLPVLPSDARRRASSHTQALHELRGPIGCTECHVVPATLSTARDTSISRPPRCFPARLRRASRAPTARSRAGAPPASAATSTATAAARRCSAMPLRASSASRPGCPAAAPAAAAPATAFPPVDGAHAAPTSPRRLRALPSDDDERVGRPHRRRHAPRRSRRCAVARSLRRCCCCVLAAGARRAPRPSTPRSRRWWPGRQDPRDGNLYSSVPRVSRRSRSTSADVHLRHVEDLRLVVSGWGELTLGADARARTARTGDLDVGFVEGKLLRRRLELRLGRQLVFGGAARAQPLDGGVGDGAPLAPRRPQRLRRRAGDAALRRAPGRRRRPAAASSGARRVDTEVGVSFLEMLERRPQARQDLGVDARWRPLRARCAGADRLCAPEPRSSCASPKATSPPRGSRCSSVRGARRLPAHVARSVPAAQLDLVGVLAGDARRGRRRRLLAAAVAPARSRATTTSSSTRPASASAAAARAERRRVGPAFETHARRRGARRCAWRGHTGYVQARLFAIQRLSHALVGHARPRCLLARAADQRPDALVHRRGHARLGLRAAAGGRWSPASPTSRRMCRAPLRVHGQARVQRDLPRPRGDASEARSVAASPFVLRPPSSPRGAWLTIRLPLRRRRDQASRTRVTPSAKVECIACHEEIYDAKTLDERVLPTGGEVPRVPPRAEGSRATAASATPTSPSARSRGRRASRRCACRTPSTSSASRRTARSATSAAQSAARRRRRAADERLPVVSRAQQEYDDGRCDRCHIDLSRYPAASPCRCSRTRGTSCASTAARRAPPARPARSATSRPSAPTATPRPCRRRSRSSSPSASTPTSSTATTSSAATPIEAAGRPGVVPPLPRLELLRGLPHARRTSRRRRRTRATRIPRGWSFPGSREVPRHRGAPRHRALRRLPRPGRALDLRRLPQGRRHRRQPASAGLAVAPRPRNEIAHNGMCLACHLSEERDAHRCFSSSRCVLLGPLVAAPVADLAPRPDASSRSSPSSSCRSPPGFAGPRASTWSAPRRSRSAPRAT